MLWNRLKKEGYLAGDRKRSLPLSKKIGLACICEGREMGMSGGSIHARTCQNDAGKLKGKIARVEGAQENGTSERFLERTLPRIAGKEVTEIAPIGR